MQSTRKKYPAGKLVLGISGRSYSIRNEDELLDFGTIIGDTDVIANEIIRLADCHKIDIVCVDLLMSAGVTIFEYLKDKEPAFELHGVNFHCLNATNLLNKHNSIIRDACCVLLSVASLQYPPDRDYTICDQHHYALGIKLLYGANGLVGVDTPAMMSSSVKGLLVTMYPKYLQAVT